MEAAVVRDNVYYLGVVEGGKKEKYIPKGDFTARPVKDRETLEEIKQLLMESGKYGYRNYAIFLLGINCGLRCGDVLQIRLKDIWDEEKQEVTGLTVLEEKTRKTRKNIQFSEKIKEGLKGYILTLKDRDPESPLFPSRKKVKKKEQGVKDNTGCLTTDSYNDILKEIRKKIGMEHLSTHSMRKTFGYNVYKRNAGKLIAGEYMAIDIVQQMLNHSSPAVTLRYIGIEEEVQNEIYRDMEL